jgi:hypothetical protein
MKKEKPKQNPRIRNAYGPLSRSKVRCKCPYCLENVSLNDREMVYEGEQCVVGWRLELTGKLGESGSEIGRSELLSISESLTPTKFY